MMPSSFSSSSPASTPADSPPPPPPPPPTTLPSGASSDAGGACRPSHARTHHTDTHSAHRTGTAPYEHTHPQSMKVVKGEGGGTVDHGQSSCVMDSAAVSGQDTRVHLIEQGACGQSQHAHRWPLHWHPQPTHGPQPHSHTNARATHTHTGCDPHPHPSHPDTRPRCLYLHGFGQVITTLPLGGVLKEVGDRTHPTQLARTHCQWTGP